MNFKHFCSIFSAVMTLFLFLIGSTMLLYLNSESVEAIQDPPQKQLKSFSLWSSFVDPFKAGLESLKIKDRKINVLLMGGDHVNKNTDTMILLSLFPQKETLTVLSLPRDTRIQNKDGTRFYKINSAYPSGGGFRARETVADTLHVPVDYYIFIDTKTFAYVIDALGGVEYNIPEKMDYDDPTQDLHIHLNKGPQLLNGKQAEGLMRFRQFNNGKVTKNYDGSDLKRITTQQGFIREFIRQKGNLSSIANFKDVLDIVLKNVDTNLTMNDILKILNFSADINASKVRMMTLPGTPEEGGSWYYIVDEERTRKLIDGENVSARADSDDEEN